MLKYLLLSVVVLCVLIITAAPIGAGDELALKKAVLFYASFDENLEPDVGVGMLWTRFNHEKEPGTFVRQPGYDAKVFRVAKGKGVAGGGCLEATDVLPRNGRVFFPMKNN